VRIVHEYLLPDGTPDVAKNEGGIARGAFPDLTASGGRRVWLRARNEGIWGNRLSARLTFNTRTLALAPGDFYATQLRVPAGVEMIEGALLRLSLPGGVRVLRRVATLREEWHPTKGAKETWATLDSTTGAPGERAELVEGVLEVDDAPAPRSSTSGWDCLRSTPGGWRRSSWTIRHSSTQPRIPGSRRATPSPAGTTPTWSWR